MNHVTNNDRKNIDGNLRKEVQEFMKSDESDNKESTFKLVLVLMDRISDCERMCDHLYNLYRTVRPRHDQQNLDTKPLNLQEKIKEIQKDRKRFDRPKQKFTRIHLILDKSICCYGTHEEFRNWLNNLPNQLNLTKEIIITSHIGRKLMELYILERNLDLVSGKLLSLDIKYLINPNVMETFNYSKLLPEVQKGHTINRLAHVLSTSRSRGLDECILSGLSLEITSRIWEKSVEIKNIRITKNTLS